MFMNFRISFIAALLVSATMWGQSKVSPFTIHYLKGQQSQVTRAITTEQVVSAYLYVDENPDVALLETLGVKVTICLDGILTVRMPLSVIPKLAQLDFIKYIQIGTPVTSMLDKARAVGGVDQVLSGEGLSMPFTGKGVVVGVIDGGFDYTHPAFRDDETGALRIKRVWEQAGSNGTVPASFGYGIELTNEESILAAGGDVSTLSHGTHVAAIAAGAYRVEDNPYYGIAPDADMILVSVNAGEVNSANISDAIAYIFNYADSVGKPCVVNMSIGWNQGPHDGTSPFDLVADNIQGPGRILVGSIGNYGNDALHTSKSFKGIDDTPLQVMVSYKKAPTLTAFGGSIDVWAEKGMELDMKMVIASKRDGTDTYVIDTLNLSAVEGLTEEYAFPSKYASGRIIVTTEVNPLNGKPHAFITLELTNFNVARYRIGLVLIPRSAGTVHAWADGNYTTFETEVPDGWIAGDKESTLCEIGGTGHKIISVGAYVSSDSYVEVGTTQQKFTGETLGALATFSSVGPTIDGRMKPDIIAPGTYIASAVNSFDVYRSSYPTASVVVGDDDTYHYYSYIQGTSMAAPYVSGVVASWLQAMPSLDSQMLRSVLQATAMNDEFTNPATSGYGKIDAYAGLKEVLTLSNGLSDDSINPIIPFVVRSMDQGIVVTFTRQLGPVEVTLTTAAGVTVEHISTTVDVPGYTVTLPVSSASHGIHLLSVAGHVIKLAL